MHKTRRLRTEIVRKQLESCIHLEDVGICIRHILLKTKDVQKLTHFNEGHARMYRIFVILSLL